MKTLHRFSLLLCLFATLSFAACGDDETDPNEDTNNRLEGSWDARSFTITGPSGSVEAMGNAFSRMSLDFDKTGPDEGEYDWTFVSQADGSTDIIRGDYEIQDGGTELQLRADGSSTDEEYEISVDGDNLELDGFLDIPGFGNNRVIVEARKN